MTIRQITDAIERKAPLSLQEGYDNAGLQVGFPDTEVSGILTCLDITEEVIDEAAETGCNLILSHHPLLFSPLSCVSDRSWQQRCVVKALAKGIALYSAHTNLDNARGGVNFKIAEKIGLQKLEWLEKREGQDAGSGLIGELPQAEDAEAFIRRVKDLFGVEALRHTAAEGRKIRRVALCGGAGSFLMRNAICSKADCFITGEIHYHDFFEGEGMLLMELGHYESEQYTTQLLREMVLQEFPDARIRVAKTFTNPITWTK